MTCAASREGDTRFTHRRTIRCLPGRSARALLFELVDDAVQVGVAGAKAASEPVPTASGNGLAVEDHVELSRLAGREHNIQAQTLLDEGHETRDLNLVVSSSRAMNDFDFHVSYRITDLKEAR